MNPTFITLNRSPRSWHLRQKLLLLPLAVAGLLLSCASCSEAPPLPEPPPPVVIDTEPVGSGLSVIGFALLGASVVIVLGKMLK